MATIKLSALALVAAASISATDVFPMTDADAGTPTTYKTNVAQLRTALLQASVGSGWGATDYLGLGAGTVPGTGMVRSGQGAIAADSPLINSTATWNNVAITFRHLLVNITDTNSAAGSLFADFQIAGASKWNLTKAGAVTQGSTLTISAGGLSVVSGTTAVQALTATTIGGTTVTASVQVITPNVATASGGTALVLANGGTTVATFSTSAATLPFATTISSGGLAIDDVAANATITLKHSGTAYGYMGMTAAGNYITGAASRAAFIRSDGIEIDFSANTGASVQMRLSSAGVLTVASGLTVTAGGLTVSAGTTAVQALTATTGVFAGAVSGVTTLSIGGALSGVTTLSMSSTLTMTAAASKIIPGANSLSHRNNADSADNILISDAGDVTIRARAGMGATGLASGVGLNMTGTHPQAGGTTLWGAVIAPTMTSATTVAGIPLQVQLVATGAFTMTSGYGLLIKTPSLTTSVVTTGYGLYIEDQITGGAATPWSIYCVSGNVSFKTSALSTGATTGHLFIPTSAGTPTGVPASIPTGQVAFQYDSTNNIIYIYNGAWKKTAALT